LQEKSINHGEDRKKEEKERGKRWEIKKERKGEKRRIHGDKD
jgi:hypothetical protein